MVVKIRRMALKTKKADPDWLQKRGKKKQEKFERRQLQKEKNHSQHPSFEDVWPTE